MIVITVSIANLLKVHWARKYRRVNNSGNKGM
jgi:hypothetical protein